MNFNFLKDLHGLSYVYENCNNAEKLAVSMPVQSVFTARKSAELLAKFIYLTAHNQEMQGLTFADILADDTVIKFINNRGVLKAFHYIRKSGNQAVHGDSEETAEDAINVLQDLHYVAGETACRLGLIQDYPQFEDEIEAFPDARFIDIDEVDAKAREMFLAYINEHEAQRERESYENLPLVPYVLADAKGSLYLSEYLKIDLTNRRSDIIEFFQEYFAFLMRMAQERSAEKYEAVGINDLPSKLDATVILDGDKNYNSSDREFFSFMLEKELPYANNAEIEIYFSGNVREYAWVDENGQMRKESYSFVGDHFLMKKSGVWDGDGMLGHLEYFKRKYRMKYRINCYYSKFGDSLRAIIENGQTFEFPMVFSTEGCTEWNDDIAKYFSVYPLDDELTGIWSSELNNLSINFDFAAHPEITETLHSLVRQYLPADQLSDSEDEWEEDYPEAPGMLVYGAFWPVRSIKIIKEFLTKINETIAPILSECDGTAMGYWEYKDNIKNGAAVAGWIWTEDGFQLVGFQY